MFSTEWRTSAREHRVRVLHDVRIPMSDGTELSADVFLPDAPGAFPALLGVHAYDAAMQSTPSIPQAMTGANAQAEAGDPYFYARRGYVHVIANARGTGRSDGSYSHYGPVDVQDGVELIAWIAAQDWCDGNVGMFGVSYFSVFAKQVAAQNPPALKAVFAMFGYTDFYRDKFYHGGILAQSFLTSWTSHLAGVRVAPWGRDALGDEEYERRVRALAEDPDIMAVPELADAVRHPDARANPLIVDVLLSPTDGPYWQMRNPDLEAIRVPIALGACWGMYGLHLPGEFRAWERITAPKTLTIGPPIYLDRPVYQYAEESLRWFDHWLKGNDTGVLDEPPVRVFLPGGEGTWRDAEEWPLPGTRWHEFFLHADGLLSEHEHWPFEGATSYQDNTYNGHGRITFTTPPLVERTTLAGPASLTLWAASTDPEILLFASVWVVDGEGNRTILSRGWLRGTLSEPDESASTRWLPQHAFTERRELRAGEVSRFDVAIAPLARVVRPGERIQLQISSADTDEAGTFLDLLAQGHLLRRHASWVSVLHDEQHPSVLNLPVIEGNRIGTYMSGGQPASRRSASGRGWEAW